MTSTAVIEQSSMLFRDLCARVPAAVYLVTTSTPAGPRGATVTSVCSVSLDPLTLLVCLDNRSGTLAAITDRGAFAVNALRAEHAPVAVRFASNADAATKYGGVAHHLSDGVPVLDGALGWFTCALANIHRSGDHTIVTGLVRSMGGGDGDPLLWHDRAFRGLTTRPTTLRPMS